MPILTALVVRTIRFCTRYAWAVIVLMLLLAVGSSYYAASHFAMTTDINQLISTDIPWRKREAAFEKAFPRFDLIAVVVEAPTTELTGQATAALVERLGNWAEAGSHHTIVSVRGVSDVSKLELIGRDVIPHIGPLGEPSPLG